jgi:hypothetical protein
MADIFPPAKQREALLPMLEALDASPSALRRDDCGDPRIDGRWGHIYAAPGSLDRPDLPGFQIVVLSEKSETGAFDRWTSQGWTYAKRAIEEFSELINNGDLEGVFFLHRLPTSTEAETIRRYCGIRKRTEYSEEALARKREQMLTMKGALGAKIPAEASLGLGWPNNLSEAKPSSIVSSDRDGEDSP